MNREEAIRLLSSSSSHDRLLAARYMERHASAADRELLQRALAVEKTHWVETALRSAVAAAAAGAPPTTEELATTPRLDRDSTLYNEALRDTAGVLVHELEPIIGRIRLYASRELKAGSPLSQEIERLAGFVKAIDTLSRAATPPVTSEFDIAGLISDSVVQTSRDVLKETVLETHVEEPPLSIELAGPTPFLVFGDVSLVELALGNALKNAIEATLETVSPTNPCRIVVNWGRNDTDYFVSVLDEGPGLPPGSSHAFAIGTTTKEGHLGMGLALMRRALRTLGGDVTLENRETGGSRCYLWWPRDGNALTQ